MLGGDGLMRPDEVAEPLLRVEDVLGRLDQLGDPEIERDPRRVREQQQSIRHGVASFPVARRLRAIGPAAAPGPIGSGRSPLRSPGRPGRKAPARVVRAP